MKKIYFLLSIIFIICLANIISSDIFREDLVIILVSSVLGYGVAFFLYILFKVKKSRQSPSIFSTLFTDFWFNTFLIRKVITFLQVLNLGTFISNVIGGLNLIFSGYSYGFVFLLVSFPLIVIFRVTLETIIAIFKITEKVSQFPDAYEINQHQESEHERSKK